MSESQSLGQYIKQQLAIKSKSDGWTWTQNELARRSGLSSGGLSMVINGKSEPTAATLKSIADALSIDIAPLLKIAGIIDKTEQLDSSALKIAINLSNLPESTRRHVVSTVESLLDTVNMLMVHKSEMIEEQPLEEEPPENPKTQEITERIKAMTELYEAKKDEAGLIRALNRLNEDIDLLELAAKRS